MSSSDSLRCIGLLDLSVGRRVCATASAATQGPGHASAGASLRPRSRMFWGAHGDRRRSAAILLNEREQFAGVTVCLVHRPPVAELAAGAQRSGRIRTVELA